MGNTSHLRAAKYFPFLFSSRPLLLHLRPSMCAGATSRLNLHSQELPCLAHSSHVPSPSQVSCITYPNCSPDSRDSLNHPMHGVMITHYAATAVINPYLHKHSVLLQYILQDHIHVRIERNKPAFRYTAHATGMPCDHTNAMAGLPPALHGSCRAPILYVRHHSCRSSTVPSTTQ